MSSIKELTELGEQFGFAGEELRNFVQEEQAKERERRLQEREQRLQEQELARELEREKEEQRQKERAWETEKFEEEHNRLEIRRDIEREREAKVKEREEIAQRQREEEQHSSRMIEAGEEDKYLPMRTFSETGTIMTTPDYYPRDNASEIQNTDTFHYLYQGRLVKTPAFHSGNITGFYLFGASITNSSETSSWDELRIYGQWHENYTGKNKNEIKCCIKYSDGSLALQSRSIKSKLSFTVISRFYYLFPVKHEGDLLPVAVSITVGDQTCLSSSLPYIEPVYPWKQPGKLGITPRIVYGTITSESIIEWLEAMKYLGVDKVIIYADESLNSDALKTLYYYKRTGLVDVFPYCIPGQDILPRNFSVTNYQMYTDQRVTNHDAYERLRGYTYFSIIDIDEFLIPSKDRSLKTLMEDLTHENVAAVFFKSAFFFKSWGKVNSSSDLELGQYLNTTELAPEFDRRKAIAMTERLDSYDSPHHLHPKFGYITLDCSENDAYLRHYRSCRHGPDGCPYKRVTDLSVIEWANANIASNVRKVRQKIFGITRLP